MPAIELDGLERHYGERVALAGVSVRVDEGQTLAVLGANGAGKTTLLRALSGLIGTTGGDVRFDGDSLTGLAAERIVSRGIAHVPEGRHLFAGLTVRENLMAGAFAGRDGPGLDRALELFPHLKDRLGQVAGSMSGGEQQMCAIARGLMSSPELLMIDELSLGLAPLVVDEIIARLPDIAAAGTAVLLVEQDVDAALTVAERAYVLETGRVAMSGQAGELLADPRVQESYLGIG